MDEYTNYLVHHGIKGQRWGVRRFQNPDGSLTSAGRSKYGVGPKKKSSGKKQTRSERRAAKKKAKEEFRKAKEIAKRKAEHDRKMRTSAGAASEAVNSSLEELREQTAKYKAAADYMDQRSRVDAYIDKYSPKEKSKGEKLVDTFQKAQKVATAAGTIYDTYNKVFGTKKPTEQELIQLETSKINLRKAQLLTKKMENEYHAKLNDDITKNNIQKAKSSFLLQSKTLSDEQVNQLTDQYKARNALVEEMFKHKR